MFDIQYLIKEWHDTRVILYPCINHILKQSMKILTISVHWKWDRLVTYWLTLVWGDGVTDRRLDRLQKDRKILLLARPSHVGKSRTKFGEKIHTKQKQHASLMTWIFNKKGIKINSFLVILENKCVYALKGYYFIALDKALFFSQKVAIFFLFLDINICCGYSLEAPRRGTSNEYPQCMFSSRNKKTIYLIPTII